MKSSQYINGKVYKITSDQTNRIYIGSTIKSLSKRMWEHKADSKYSNISSGEVLQYNDAKIVLIELFPCKSKDELRTREQFWIEQNKAIVVNKIPARSLKIIKSPRIECQCGQSIIKTSIYNHRNTNFHLKYLQSIYPENVYYDCGRLYCPPWILNKLTPADCSWVNK